MINTYLICESDLNSDFGKANNANIYYVIVPSVYHTSLVIIYFLITKNIFYILNFLCMVLNKFINNTFLKKFSIMKYKNNIVVIMFLKYFKIFIWMHFLNKKKFWEAVASLDATSPTTSHCTIIVVMLLKLSQIRL